MHHGEEVVRPVRQGTRTVVGVGDEIERADLGAERIDGGVGTSQTLMPLAV